MKQRPEGGRIVIEWTRADSAGERFAWGVHLEPPGLSDDDVAALLHEIADKFGGPDPN